MSVIRGVLIWVALSWLVYMFLFLLDNGAKKFTVLALSRVIAAGAIGLILSVVFLFLNQLQGL